VGIFFPGTGVRLLMGAMATSPIHVTFKGDGEFGRKRPMGSRHQGPWPWFGTQAYGLRGRGGCRWLVVGG